MDNQGKAESTVYNLKNLSRNVWATSLTSFFMDISSEMVIYMIPLFLANILGVRTSIIGVIEGIAESTASLIKVFSGWFSDQLRARKWLAVGGYAISAAVKPLFYYAQSWGTIAVVRWADRVGKGIRTAPRDALIADSANEEQAGLAFGFQRAADTAGAMLGLIIALVVVWWAQSNTIQLNVDTFRAIVLVSLFPALLAVLILAVGAQDVRVTSQRTAPKFAFRSLGKPFMIFMIIVCLFELGNSSDAFLILRAQDIGLSVTGILTMLIVFNLIYALVSTPAGLLSDRTGRCRVITAGWLIYALVYLGFSQAQNPQQVWLLYAVYGLYYGLAYGTSKALVSDMVLPSVRGTAYGTYNAALGIMNFPASLLAGVLWDGIGRWSGFGPTAPFLFGAILALIAALLLAGWLPNFLPDSTAI